MTVTVDVPKNTPSEDTVYLQSGTHFTRPMTRVDSDTWTIAFSIDDLGDPDYKPGLNYKGADFDNGSQMLKYTFTRGWGYLGAESLTDRHTDPFWANARSVKFEVGITRKDVVDRWRWFPPDGTALPSHPAALSQWLPRINGAEFQAGVLYADLWDDTIPPLMAPTNAAAKGKAGATWVQIDPPWDYQVIDPLPVISNENVQVPAYSDAALRAHIKDIKAGGLKVMMEPQVCCNSVSAEHSEEWLRAWFNTYENFLLYHARVAAEEKVDAMFLDWSGAQVNALPGSHNAPAWTLERWREMMRKVRTVYKGPIGYNTLIIGDGDKQAEAWPWSSLQPIADQFDFIGVAVWSGIATSANESQTEMDRKMEHAIDVGVLPIYEATKRPVVFTGIAFASFDGAAINDKGVFEVALESYYPEQNTKLAWDGVEQAMAFQALMQAVAERPYVTGVYPFLYQYLAMPLSPDYSVRDKPAEALLKTWYERALGKR